MGVALFEVVLEMVACVQHLFHLLLVLLSLSGIHFDLKRSEAEFVVLLLALLCVTAFFVFGGVPFLLKKLLPKVV